MLFLIKHKGDHFFILGLIFFFLGHICKLYCFMEDCICYSAKYEYDINILVVINFIHFGLFTLVMGYMYPYMGKFGHVLFL